MQIQEEPLLECSCIGPVVFTDDECRNFYLEYSIDDLSVKIGDCVRIKLDFEIKGDDFAFGQVLAIYEDVDEAFVEVRWFVKERELSSQHRKIIEPQQNELVETCKLDDIPAGAVTEVIDIKGVDSTKRLTPGHFICRFLVSAQSSALQKVAPHSMLPRGMDYSHYSYAYADHMKTLNIDHQSDPFSVAIQRLHISVIPDTLPCRGAERKAIEDYIKSGIQCSGSHRPIYICGMPGTGKTATVLACIASLRKEVQKRTLPEFTFLEINCLRLKSPADAYTLLWRGMTGVHLAPKTAQKRLISHFSGEEQRVGACALAPQEQITVCLVDELDYLITRNFEVMYHFYSWPMFRKSNFILIGIANTMDLPEKLSTRLNSRAEVSSTIDRLIFKPYNFEQIREILTKRLEALHLADINAQACDIISRMAASVAGDLRAALRICQRTIELYRDLVVERERARTVQRQMRRSASAADGSTSTSAAGASAVVVDDGPIKLTFGEIRKLAAEATQCYKETPFIAVTARTCQLDKAILIVMGKYRHTACGGEGSLTEASMTCDMIWDRFGDIMRKIDAERYLLAGQESTNSATSGAADGNADASPSVLTLYTPPFTIFVQALERLCQQGIVIKAPTWKILLGPRSVLYSLHSNFAYSDLIAALNGDPLLKFCLH